MQDVVKTQLAGAGAKLQGAAVSRPPFILVGGLEAAASWGSVGLV
jgi:hypothetical protein